MDHYQSRYIAKPQRHSKVETTPPQSGPPAYHQAAFTKISALETFVCTFADLSISTHLYTCTSADLNCTRVQKQQTNDSQPTSGGHTSDLIFDQYSSWEPPTEAAIVSPCAIVGMYLYLFVYKRRVRHVCLDPAVACIGNGTHAAAFDGDVPYWRCSIRSTRRGCKPSKW